MDTSGMETPLLPPNATWSDITRVGSDVISASSSATTSINDTNATYTNSSAAVPPSLTFNTDGLVSVIAYSVLFCIAASGNVTVFVTLCRHRRKSRVNWFIMHLSIADMIVTFVMMPLEVAWHLTVSWRAGDVACRVAMFFRVLGFYLSSSVLIAICLDRYHSISKPLSIRDAKRRGQIMITFAWTFSIVASVPQSVIFHIEQHPDFPWYKQCVTFNFFPSPAHELAYNLFNMTAMYLGPLLVIIFTYLMIFYQLYQRSRAAKQPHLNGQTAVQLRTSCRNGVHNNIQRAKARTLRMTAVIVLVFVMCWTPYFVISAWWWIDKPSARKLDPKIQRILFIFAVSNSCVNPIVYGVYTRTIYEQLCGWLSYWCACITTPWHRTESRTASATINTRSTAYVHAMGPHRESHTSITTDMPYVIMYDSKTSPQKTDPVALSDYGCPIYKPPACTGPTYRSSRQGRRGAGQVEVCEERLLEEQEQRAEAKNGEGSNSVAEETSHPAPGHRGETLKTHRKFPNRPGMPISRC